MSSTQNKKSKRYLSDIELVVVSTKELENRLVNELHATKFRPNRGSTSFYEKQQEVEYLFSQEEMEKFKYISNVRNILVHKVGENRINNRKKFEQTVKELNLAINAAKKRLSRTPKPSLKSNTNCFIATAVYGHYDEYEVKVLRTYRDEKLLTNTFGKFFVKLYYTVSPPIADFLRQHSVLAKPIRKILDFLVEKIK